MPRTGKLTYLGWIAVSAAISLGLGCLGSGMCLPGARAVLTVENIYDVPTSCRSWGGKHRSNAPSFNALGYCGIIDTDHGPFHIRESGWHIFGMAREDIVDSLKSGCVYEVEYRGGRSKFANMVVQGASLRNFAIPVMTDLTAIGTCTVR